MPSGLPQRLVVIRRSPEEEHTYARVHPPLPVLVRRPSSAVRRQLQPPGHGRPAQLLNSDDEVFSDDSNLSAHDTRSVRPPSERLRPVASSFFIPAFFVFCLSSFRWIGYREIIVMSSSNYPIRFDQGQLIYFKLPIVSRCDTPALALSLLRPPHHPQ